jgi:diguanylate cyclase (GGDEF)-like protein
VEGLDGRNLLEAQLYALVEVSAGAAGAHRLEDVLELAAERALAAIDRCSLSISRWEAGEVITLINVGEMGPGEERFPVDERYPLSEFPKTLRVLTGGGVLVAGVDDPSSDPAHRALLRDLGKETSLTVPIVYEGETWGELWATSESGQPRFVERDGFFLRAIADQIAAAIGRAELFLQVEALAYTDPLTEVSNRRVLEEALERACAASPGTGTPALLLCDIDGLKAINDNFGHDAGDRIIMRVAAALTDAAADNPGAVVARMGGDEFCVLLPNDDAETARALAENASARLAADEGSAIEISYGIAACGSRGASPADLLRAADLDQYRAKRLGQGLKRTQESSAREATANERAYRDRARARAEFADELLALLDTLDANGPDGLRHALRSRLTAESITGAPVSRPRTP